MGFLAKMFVSGSRTKTDIGPRKKIQDGRHSVKIKIAAKKAVNTRSASYICIAGVFLQA